MVAKSQTKKAAFFWGFGVALYIAPFPYVGPQANTQQQQAQQQQTQLRREVKVTLKLVQVYVPDKKGDPVLDLNKDDFIVLDEGQKQSLTEFEKHVLTTPSEKEEAPMEVVETTAPPAHDLLSRKFFLFFDFAFNNGIGLEKARKAALHFIGTQLQPSDEVGLISYSAVRSLTLHEPLTTDHKAIQRAVKRVGIEQIAGRAETFEEEYWRYQAYVNPADASSAGSVWQKQGSGGYLEMEVLMDSGNEIRRQEAKTQVFNFATKMIVFAKALRYVPGHKYLVLLSSGVPHSLVYGVQTPYHKIGMHDWGEFWLQEKYEDMLKELSAANCTVCALDTQDLTQASGSDSRMQGASILQKMTSATGGKYFGNINFYEKHIDKIQNLTGCYYVLGYYVDDTWDGAYHLIKVEVSRPGLKIHAQKGYFNPKPFDEHNDLERMLHLVDLALSEEPLFQTPVRFPLEVVPCPDGSKGNLCLAAKISVEKIREVLAGKSEFVAVIFDDKENIVMLGRNEKETYSLTGDLFTFGAAFSLSPGKYQCRLVIRNLETGRRAVASAVIPSS